MVATTVFLILIALMIVGVPIGISLGLTALATMLWMGGSNLALMMIQRMYTSTTSFPLLAIPFFILAGNLMNSGGVTQRIFNVAQLFVGRVRGGLGIVNVIASMLFAGMSGSAVADASGLGVVELKAMRDAGYDDEFAATITIASSTIGPVVPPSIPMVIYGSLAGVSVGGLFLGGILPGLLMGLSLMIVVLIVAYIRKMPRSHESRTLGEKGRILFEAIPAIATPVLIVGGILGGICTPTEAAALASVYTIILGTLFYRDLRLRDIPQIAFESAKQSIQVLFIIAAAGAFGWVLIQQQIPNAVVDALLSISDRPWIILLIVNIVLLILGMFMEGIAIMIITFPIFLPLMESIGVSPIHFGVLMVLNTMVGLITPPVGMCLFAVAGISGCSIAALVRESWPYLVALIAVLLLVTYVPSFVLFIPGLFGIVP